MSPDNDNRVVSSVMLGQMSRLVTVEAEIVKELTELSDREFEAEQAAIWIEPYPGGRAPNWLIELYTNEYYRRYPVEGLAQGGDDEIPF